MGSLCVMHMYCRVVAVEMKLLRRGSEEEFAVRIGGIAIDGVREWDNKRERGGSVGCIHVLLSKRCIISYNGL